ncbi:hypothetical protein OAU73_01970 [Candidatus Pelagibacter sp.]|nr:hypothetical protein [Candidatus Pelagibacter sp.]
MIAIKARGYVSSSKINGSSIPQQVQNMAIRDYCYKKNYDYLLSAVEYAMKDSFFSLKEALSDSYSDIIVFYSLHQLPENVIERNEIYNLAIKNKSIEFAIENMRLKNKKNISEIENILSVEKIMKKYHKFYDTKNLNLLIKDAKS